MTSAFCSVTVEEIVRGETREEKMFVVERLWIRRVEERKERKGREERKQRQQAIVLSLLVVRLPAVTSPLFTPTPEQLSRAFLFRHRFDIHCATDSLFCGGRILSNNVIDQLYFSLRSKLTELSHSSLYFVFSISVWSIICQIIHYTNELSNTFTRVVKIIEVTRYFDKIIRPVTLLSKQRWDYKVLSNLILLNLFFRYQPIFIDQATDEQDKIFIIYPLNYR